MDEVPLLKGFQHLYGFALGARPQDGGKFAHPADPFSGVDGVADAVHPQIRGAEVGIGAEDDITKKKGTGGTA